MKAILSCALLLMAYVVHAADAEDARLLAPLFARPRAWQVLDALIGLTMWAIAAKLIAR